MLEFTNESRNVEIVKDRLYFVNDSDENLVEYDLELLDEFIKEKMDYNPRTLTDSPVSDFYVEDTKSVWVLSPDGDLKKLKSLLRISFLIKNTKWSKRNIQTFTLPAYLDLKNGL
jgi:hypothetical protein